MDMIETRAVIAFLAREANIWAKDKNAIFLRFFLQPGVATLAFGKIIAPHVGTGDSYSTVIITGITMSFVMTFCMLNVSHNISLGYNTRLFETWLTSPISIGGLVTALVISATFNGVIAGTIIICMNALILGGSVIAALHALPAIFLSALLLSTLACLLYLAPKTPVAAQGLIPYIVLPMANLGCVYYSYAMLPTEWKYFSLMIPMTYATETARSMMGGSALFSSPWQGLILLCALCCLSLIILTFVAKRRLGEYLW